MATKPLPLVLVLVPVPVLPPLPHQQQPLSRQLPPLLRPPPPLLQLRLVRQRLLPTLATSRPR